MCEWDGVGRVPGSWSEELQLCWWTWVLGVLLCRYEMQVSRRRCLNPMHVAI